VNLRNGITLIPILHGRISFARHVRAVFARRRFDCVAVDLPEPFEPRLAEAIDALPIIQAVVACGPGEPLYYVPADPCDAAIEGLRQARQNHIASCCIASPTLATPTPLDALPDAYALHSIGFDAFAALCLRAIGDYSQGSREDLEAQYLAWRLLQLRTRRRAICGLIHMRHFVRVVYHLHREHTHNLSFAASPAYDMQRYAVHPDHLYFALGELPFVTAKHEQERYSAFAQPVDPVDCVKDLFRETRDNYFDDKSDIISLSPARIQAGLRFLRNLTVAESRLMPSLFDIVTAAKGIGQNAFAVRILKSAKYYPYLPFEQGLQSCSVGIDRLSLPDAPNARRAINLLRDTHVSWQTLAIKPDPDELHKRRYRFRWNPLGMCSHVPEDRRIESFNAHTRAKALRSLTEDYVKTEKFSTSVKDGVDIRETLRNWHTGAVYVREIPPARGAIDTVVIIFDDEHDERYPHQATWFAEHKEESTLTFYATDPFDDMIGPGIARCFYGGLSLLFPPRLTPNAFEITEHSGLARLSERLTYGSLLFSRERAIAYVAAKRPGIRLRTLAARAGKHIIWIPSGSFSGETLRALRRFHVLNGKEVRSWAARFIGD
jgi:hypothetical protein